MTRKERLHFFLVWLALGVAPLFIRSLWQPDEGRYAEIPREMLASGDWLTPRLNYVLYFEKPPLQYWLSAISMRLFGESAFAVRLPLALAAFLTMYAAWRLAWRLGGERPIWTSFAAASCMLLYVCGQILTLDALFGALCVFSLAAAVEAVGLRYRHSGEDRGTGAKWPIAGWTLALYAGVALAVLVKGPAALVLVGGTLFFGSFAALGPTPGHRRLRMSLFKTFFSPYGWLAFLVIAVPWFAAVEAANPGHARFFFYTEHFERFTTNKHARQGSKNPILDKLYFVPVVLLGAMPWLGSCLLGLRRALGFIAAGSGPSLSPSLPDAPLHRWTALVLLVAFAWPLLFFSLSGSKLIPYVTPCMVPLIALAAAFEKDGGGFRSIGRAGAEMLALGAAFLLGSALVFFAPGGGSGWASDLHASGGGPWILLLGLVFALLGIWAVSAAGTAKIASAANAPTAPRWMAWHCALLLTLSMAAQRVNGASSAIDGLVAMAPRENVQWISHGNYYQALPFLTKGRVAVVGHTGELRFGKDRLAPSEQDRWFVEDRRALTETAVRLRLEDPGRPVWAISDKRAWRGLPPDSQAAWEVVGEAPNKVLLRLM
jgi:4-amino-4-deoxy-L-arabinose transferase-like glycosyltransferase